MDYNQHVILFNNLLVYFDSVISALYHSCSQTRFTADCHAVEDRLKHNLSKFSTLQASINCGAYISAPACDTTYNLYSDPNHPHHQQQYPPSYITAAPQYPGYIAPPYSQAAPVPAQPYGVVYYNNNNSEQDEEFSSQETELSSTEVDQLKVNDNNNNNNNNNDNNTARVASFVSLQDDGSSRSTSPEVKRTPKKCSTSEGGVVENGRTDFEKPEPEQYQEDEVQHQQQQQEQQKVTKELLPKKPETTQLQRPSQMIENKNLNGDRRKESFDRNAKDSLLNGREENYQINNNHVSVPKSRPIVDNEGFILVNRRIQKARERRERILQKRREVFRNHKQKSEIIKNESQAQKENLGQTIEERQKRAELNRNEIQMQKIRKAQAEDDKIKINSLVASIDAQSKKGSLYLKDASSSRRIEEVKARKWQQFALKDALFNARREYCETKELERREMIKSQSQMKLLRAEEARREKIESTQKKEQSWAEKTNAIKIRKVKENEDLKMKIQEKINKQQKRYEENLEQKRQKAFELSVRSSLLNNNDNALLCEFYNPSKICKLCGVKIKSEVYLFGHMQSRLHCDMFEKHLKTLKNPLTIDDKDSLNMSFIVDDDSSKNSNNNNQQNINNNLNQNNNDNKDNQDITNDYYGKRNTRFIKKLKNFLNNQFQTLPIEEIKSPKINSLLCRIHESIENKNSKILSTRIEILYKELSNNHESMDCKSLEALVLSLKVLSDKTAFSKCYQAIVLHFQYCDNFKQILLHSKLCLILIDIFDDKLCNSSAGDSRCLEDICRLLHDVLRADFDKKDADKRFVENIVNYLFSIGTFEKLCMLIKSYRFNENHNFLLSLVELLETIFGIVFASNPQLVHSMNAIKNSEFCGLVSWMYEMVFRTGSSIRNDEIANKFNDDKLMIVVRIFHMFNGFPIDIVQNVLGQEGISLQIRHLCSFLIWIMKSPKKNSKIDIILRFIARFTFNNCDNQTLLRCGASPTVIEQLVQSDISYFISSNSMIIPALIGLCYRNSHNYAIMSNDLSPLYVLEFIDQQMKSDQSSLTQLLGINQPESAAIRDYFSGSISSMDS